MDKWLWAARFFKTRSLAARACELGRIHSNGQPAKAAREVRIGDMLGITNDGGDFQVEVLLLSDVRGQLRLRKRFIQRPLPAANCA
jgi:ribosome-associated heat shock protein Hsp15